MRIGAKGMIISLGFIFGSSEQIWYPKGKAAAAFWETLVKSNISSPGEDSSRTAQQALAFIISADTTKSHSTSFKTNTV